MCARVHNGFQGRGVHRVMHSITASSSNVESLIIMLISYPTNGKYKSEVVSRLSPSTEAKLRSGERRSGRGSVARGSVARGTANWARLSRYSSRERNKIYTRKKMNSFRFRADGEIRHTEPVRPTSSPRRINWEDKRLKEK